MKLLSLVVLSSVLSINAFAADCATKAPKNTEWKECKAARSNVVVDQFMLTTDGDLYAYIKKGNRLCQITNNVKSMKASAHKNDAATLYFERSGDLYVANDVRATSNCPTMTKKVIMENVAKYSVVSNTNTTIVNAALSNSGKFVAWDNVKPVYSDYLVKDYLMNTNYGASGKAFSSYVVFTQDYAGYITKVKGKGYIQDKMTDKAYSSIQAFKKANKLD